MSLTFYFCVYFVLVVLAVLSPKGRRINFALLFFLLVALLVPAWRTEGVDRALYLTSMNGTSVYPVAEASFYHVCRLAAVFSPDQRLVFLIYAAIGVGGTLFLLWLVNRRLWWCVLLYYSHFYVMHGMIQIRFANSVLFFLVFAFLWNACPPETGRRLCSKMGALVAFAGSVYWHHSGCVGLIVPFLRRNRIMPLFCLLLIVAALVSYVCGFSLSGLLKMVPLSFVQAGFDRYNAAMSIGKEMGYHALGLLRTFKLALAVVLLAYSTRIVRFSRTSAFFQIWLVGLCIGLFFADYPSLAGRLSDYFESAEYLFLPTAAFAICGRFGVIPVLLYCFGITYCELLRSGLLPL